MQTETSQSVAPAPLTFDQLWTPGDAARALQVSRSLVYRMANRGELPSLKISNRLRFNPADVEAWVHGQTRGV